MVKTVTFTSKSGELETQEVVTVDDNYYALVMTLRQLMDVNKNLIRSIERLSGNIK